MVWISHWKIEHPIAVSGSTNEFDEMMALLIHRSSPDDDIRDRLFAAASWDGRLVSLSNETGSAALWLLMYSDWFSLIW